TKAWREIRARVATQRRAAPRPPMPAATPLPEALASGDGGAPAATSAGPRGPAAGRGDAAADARARGRGRGGAPVPAPAAPGEGNAEEWLGAVPSSLAPAPEAPPPVQRIRLRYRKLGPARFIGTREIGSVFLRAARRARLPLAFSQGHPPMPRLSFSPAIPLGFSSDDEYVDLDLTAATPPETVAARLAAELPEGLEPAGAVEVSRAAPSIDAGIAAFVYEVDLAALDRPPSPDAVAAALERF